jgi:hypothetical protein
MGNSTSSDRTGSNASEPNKNEVSINSGVANKNAPKSSLSSSSNVEESSKKEESSISTNNSSLNSKKRSIDKTVNDDSGNKRAPDKAQIIKLSDDYASSDSVSDLSDIDNDFIRAQQESLIHFANKNPKIVYDAIDGDAIDGDASDGYACSSENSDDYSVTSGISHSEGSCKRKVEECNENSISNHNKNKKQYICAISIMDVVLRGAENPRIGSDELRLCRLHDFEVLFSKK